MRERPGDVLLPFERTALWRSAFAETHRNRLRHSAFFANHLRELRDKARVLIDRIRSNMPYLTVHDLTHLDALWEIGNIIAGASYLLTPAEGYVFGASVLLHDAAMCLAAYPRGLADITVTNEWKDSVVMLNAELYGSKPTADQISNPPQDIVERAVPIVLRLLHTKQAEELPRRKWKNAAGDEEYLIENAELRDFYGQIIGRIARSHGESISWVQSELCGSLGSLPAHDGGQVNALKLACILRVADAAHIDARRAPRFERTVVRPEGISDLHWGFQGKLAKPSIERDTLVYTSGSAFSLAEADAWWLCFDAVQESHRQLRDVDVALEDASQPRLKARRVRGAESPQELARLVRTEGWEPVDARLKVSDVQSLVRMFGGAHLYGSDHKVVVRELVQNAADAIKARRKLERNFEGEIVVRIVNRDGHYWLEVEDNGVGMSERTITGTLLDFGRSFWVTDVQKEFPGLMAKGMSPTGKFGIGFFSVFMVGDVVRVTSRRYDSGSDDTRTLEFRSGLALRPILRNASSEEAVHGGGTRVAVLLRTSPYEKGGLLVEDVSGEPKQQSLSNMVGMLCPSLDVAVTVQSNGRRIRALKRDDWRRVKGSTLLMRIEPSRSLKGASAYGSRLRPIRSGKFVYGRACIRGDRVWEEPGVITVGGLAAMKAEYIEGILLGTTEALARNTASISAPPLALARWAEEQAKILARSRMIGSVKLTAAGIVIACGGRTGKLPIARIGGRYLNESQLEGLVRTQSEITVFDGEPYFDEDRDDCHPREFRDWFKSSPGVVFLGDIPSASVGKHWWPGRPSYWSVLEMILERRWKQYDARTEERVVGKVDSFDITRDVEIITRKP
jgi:Histidine kinase-, DNA gyrase B-, and HSP90-like ATPase